MALDILLASIGSSGDLHPVIELGRALRARGHSVALVANEIFSEQIGGNGLEFVQMGSADDARAMMSDPRLWHPRKGFRCIAEGGIVPYIGRLYRIIEERRGPRTVVAASTLCLGARVAQEKLGIPTATLHLQPCVIRSYFDNGKLSWLNMGPGMPRPVKSALFWFMDTFYVERFIGPELGSFRASLGLPPIRGIFSAYLHSPQLVLGLFPEWFAPPQPDWPAHTHLTGFLLHDDGGDAEVRSEALAFLDEGPPPLLVTPGSAAMDRTEFFRHTVNACTKAGIRAMLITNHAAQLPRDLPEGIKAFPYVPFSSVLPRCAAIAYHGGIGTLAQAVRAGTPQLVVSNAHDQPDNGQRIERLGLGLTVSTGRFRGRAAARAISGLLGSGDIRRRCREFAPRIDNAAASRRACELIEGLG